MMRIRKTALFLLLAVMLAVSASFACAIGAVKDPEQEKVYDQLRAYCVKHMYTEGVGLYLENPGMESYLDAAMYYRYMQGQIEFGNENYAEAASLFESVPSFLDSDGFAAYCSGRVAETKGDWQTAVQCYFSCLGIMDAADRYRASKEKQGEAEKEAAYNAACEAFEAAVAEGNSSAVEKCRLLFESFGAYKESAGYIALCSEWLAAARRTLNVSAVPDRESIRITWSDNEPGHEYVLEYAVSGSVRKTVVSGLTAQETVIDGLIPGTCYGITLKDAANAQVSVETEVYTARADAYAAGGVFPGKITLAGIERRYLDTGLIMAEEAFSSYPDLVVFPADNALNAAWLQQTAPYVRVSLTKNLEEAIKQDIAYVVRSSLYGTYRLSNDSLELPAGSGQYMFAVALDPVLSLVKEEYGRIPADNYLFEIYLDGALWAETGFSVN